LREEAFGDADVEEFGEAVVVAAWEHRAEAERLRR